MKFDVFRDENRRGGSSDWLGEVEADSLEGALADAASDWDCDNVHYLWVAEQECDDNQPLRLLCQPHWDGR